MMKLNRTNNQSATYNRCNKSKLLITGKITHRVTNDFSREVIIDKSL